MKRSELVILVDTREQDPLPFDDIGVKWERANLGLRGGDYRVKGLDADGDPAHPLFVVERKDRDLWQSLPGGHDYERVRAELLHIQREVRAPHRCILACKTERQFYEECSRWSSRPWETIRDAITTLEVEYGFPVIWRRGPLDAARWVAEQARMYLDRYSNPLLLDAISAMVRIPPAGLRGGATISHEAAHAAGRCSVCLAEWPRRKSTLAQAGRPGHCRLCGRKDGSPLESPAEAC